MPLRMLIKQKSALIRQLEIYFFSVRLQRIFFDQPFGKKLLGHLADRAARHPHVLRHLRDVRQFQPSDIVNTVRLRITVFIQALVFRQFGKHILPLQHERDFF